MSKKLYDILSWCKIIIGILIPLVIGLNEIWHFTYGYQIIQTMTVLEAALIAALKIDSIDYFSDKEIVEKN